MKVTGAPHPGGSVARRTSRQGATCISVAQGRDALGALTGSWWFHCGFCRPGSASFGFPSWRAAHDAADAHLARHLGEWTMELEVL